MVAQSVPQQMTPQDYLDWEAQQPIKYEYINGHVVGMTGGTIPHNDLALNLAVALKQHLRGKSCKVQIADAKVGVSEQGPFFYPDVMVSCDPRDQRARQVIYHPCLIIEVLSPSTEAFDRGQKFRHYRRIDALKEYVLIDSEQVAVECYRLNDQGIWEFAAYPPDETTPDQATQEIHLTSIDLYCSLELIYENVNFPDEDPFRFEYSPD